MSWKDTAAHYTRIRTSGRRGRLMRQRSISARTMATGGLAPSFLFLPSLLQILENRARGMR